MSDVVEQFRRSRIVPVVVVDDPATAVPLARALAEGGLPCVEVTLRTAGAVEALRRVAGEVPEVLVGAGTVLTPEQADDARGAGARFVMAPGFNPRVVDHCAGAALPCFPGVCTPTEVEAALERGVSVLKFFPAAPAGGVTYLRAIAAPYSGVQFIPTGGVDMISVAEYLRFERVVACGGTWIAPRELIREGRYEEIRRRAASAVEAVRSLEAS